MKTIHENKRDFVNFIKAEDPVKIAFVILKGYKCKWEGFYITKRDLAKYKNKMDKLTLGYSLEKNQFWYKGIPIQTK